MTHLTEEDQILLYYNEPSVRDDAREHLRECAECRGAAQSLAQTLDLADEWTVPEVEIRFETPLPQPSRWNMFLALAAAAAVLLIAFVAGHVTRQNNSAVPLAGLSAPARERILAISLADHLDRAQLLLTEISNQSAEPAAERARAQDLVEEGRLLRQALNRNGPSATLATLDEVERLLLQIAHAELPAPEERVASDSVLFKLRIIESNLRTQGNAL